MKVVVCGKGGSGKSSLTAMIASGLNDQGFRVLLIDADESNLGLHRMIGLPYPLALLDSLGGKKGFREKTASPFPQGPPPEIFKDGMRIEDIPEACVSRSDGIGLVVVGKIHDFGEGCACPMGAISKMFLPKLNLRDDEIVLIDTAAGVEHFGRGVDGAADLIIGVVDPAYESFLLAENMRDMAARAGIDIFFVLNKVEEQNRQIMLEKLEPAKVVAAIAQSSEIYLDNLNGKKLNTRPSGIDKVCRFIAELKKTGSPKK